MQVMFAAIIALVLILGINFSSRITASQPLQQTYDEVRAEVERLQSEQADLIIERDYVRSDVYVERWARDEGKMVRPGEVLVVPVPASTAPQIVEDDAPVIAVETSPPQEAPWAVWWSLFFDGAPPEF